MVSTTKGHLIRVQNMASALTTIPMAAYILEVGILTSVRGRAGSSQLLQAMKVTGRMISQKVKL